RAETLATTPDVPDLDSELRRRGVAHVDDLRALGVADVPTAGRSGGWLLDPGAVPGLVERLTAALAEHARRAPLEPGLPVEAARRSLELPDARLLPVVLAHPAAAGAQAVDGREIGRASCRARGEQMRG